MKMIHKRNRYQDWFLTTEKRRTGAEVYIFRWHEQPEAAEVNSAKSC
jgi:hypothetical protein